ncbi:MAG: glycosyltransferase family 4 protein [Candidatus Omnitrophota bacterium]
MSRLSEDIALGLTEAGSSVIVLALDDNAYQNKEIYKFPIFRIKGLMPKKIFTHYIHSLAVIIMHAMYLAIKFRPEVILVNSWTIPGISAYILTRVFRLPYFVLVHGQELLNSAKSQRVSFLMRRVLGNSRKVIAISDFTRKLMQETVPSARWVILNPTIDIDKFTLKFKENPKVIPGKTILLTVARLAPHKGHEQVILALKELLPLYPELIYRIVGDGERRGYLENLVNTSGLSGKVIFEGDVKQQDLLFFYDSCNIFIMCSRYMPEDNQVEGFGIVFLEAGAFNKPVIAGNSGGIPDAVIDQETGILVDPEDISQIAQSIKRLISDPDFARRLADNGRRRAVELSRKNFSIRLKDILKV